MVLKKFTRVSQLLRSGGLKEGHFAKDLELSDPIVPALEYFLSLQQVIGFNQKFRDLGEKPLGSMTKNDRQVQWASLCAEFGAIYLLGRTLGIKIIGFDQKSPRAQRAEANCDLLALIHGHHTFIEVKRKAAEDKQLLPGLLYEKLRLLGLPFNISIELIDRNYNCSALDTQLSKLWCYVKAFQSKPGRPINSRPASFNAGAFRVSFVAKSDPESAPIECFSPDSIEELKSYLLGPGGAGKDGTLMKPMTIQAREKGADYLFCRTPKWGNWRDIVGRCFANVTCKNAQTYFTSDRTVLDLRGIVLFSRYDDFCIINNLNAKDGARIVA
jgi:hypothetical protein